MRRCPLRSGCRSRTPASGSATPAMESFHNGNTGRYDLLTLPQRVAARPLPRVDVVDLRRNRTGGSLLVSPHEPGFGTQALPWRW